MFVYKARRLPLSGAPELLDYQEKNYKNIHSSLFAARTYLIGTTYGNPTLGIRNPHY
jgi:hypothetical protein